MMWMNHCMQGEFIHDFCVRPDHCRQGESLNHISHILKARYRTYHVGTSHLYMYGCGCIHATRPHQDIHIGPRAYARQCVYQHIHVYALALRVTQDLRIQLYCRRSNRSGHRQGGLETSEQTMFALTAEEQPPKQASERYTHVSREQWRT